MLLQNFENITRFLTCTIVEEVQSYSS
jgi:hypothetical protein